MNTILKEFFEYLAYFKLYPSKCVYISMKYTVAMKKRSHEGVIPTQGTGSSFYSTLGTEGKIWLTPTLKV